MTVTLPLASYWNKYLHPELSRLAEPVQGWFYTIQPQGDLSVNLLALIGLGLIVGLLAGFFGVGGGFLMTPLLNLISNVPYNVAVGTDLTQMVGTATIANLRQRGFGYVDYKLALLMFLGSMIGVESGAQLLEILKYGGEITLGGYRLTLLQLVMTIVYSILLFWVSSLVYREASAILKTKTIRVAPPPPASPVASRLRSINLPPMISLPVSGVESVSIWLILAVGWVAGVCTGLLGVSGGFLRMPALIYVLGIPTVVSIGTNLFELLVAAIYGALTHSLKGNVELVLVIVLLVSSTVGTQLGAALQRKFAGPRLQQLFAGLIVVIICLMFLKLFS